MKFKIKGKFLGEIFHGKYLVNSVGKDMLVYLLDYSLETSTYQAINPETMEIANGNLTYEQIMEATDTDFGNWAILNEKPELK